MGIQGIHRHTWVYRVYMVYKVYRVYIVYRLFMGIQGIHGYTGYTGYTWVYRVDMSMDILLVLYGKLVYLA